MTEETTEYLPLTVRSMNSHSFFPYLTQGSCLGSKGSISSIGKKCVTPLRPHPPGKSFLGMLRDASLWATQISFGCRTRDPTSQ